MLAASIIIKRALRWTFEDRTTGHIVVAQAPNLELWLFLAAWAVSTLIHPAGRIGTAVRMVELTALTVWSVDEVFRGVNPWRRLLGTAAFAYVLFEIFKH